MFDNTHVLVIEDDAGIRMTLTDLLAAEGCTVDAKPDGPSGEVAARTGEFDIILLDLMLPGRDGLAICTNLRAAGLQTPIIMLTARGADLDVVIGLRQGADDYLPKPFDSGVLIARMEALLRRAAAVSRFVATGGNANGPNNVSFGDFRLDRKKGELTRAGETIPLNAQEFRLLEFFVANPDKVIGRDVILDLVWGYDTETTTRTIDVHVAKLRQRLGESDLPRHILTVRGRGYKFRIKVEE